MNNTMNVMKKSKKENENLIFEENIIFKPLDEMVIPEPSADFRESFSQKLDRISANESINSTKRQLHIYIKAAVIAAIFVSGWFLGSIYNRSNTALLQDVQKQLDSNNNLLILTLLQQSSASDRLQAANVSYSLSSIDNQVITALIKALENDPDPNVKIKCAEALATHLKPDTINRIFGKALDYQSEPLIQLILIDYIKSVGNDESKRIVNNFINSGKADEFVRSEVKKTFNL